MYWPQARNDSDVLNARTRRTLKKPSKQDPVLPDQIVNMHGAELQCYMLTELQCYMLAAMADVMVGSGLW